MAQDYNNTLNLPKTDFAMRASLPKREPVMLAEWNEENLYQKMVDRNEGKPTYILHDGPPYANGDIHLGTALNKILKDIIVRSKNMTGFQSPYIPGWDTHGLPIELKALKAVGVTADISPLELRQHCKDFALHYVENQRNQFKRLGVLGEFAEPYLTLRPEFEARQVEIFGEMAKKGYIYKGLKPVHWCPHCRTALAEAEIEYADDPCYSIYVKFEVTDDKNKLFALGAVPGKTYVVIWTTTTWTIPANVAICLGPDFDYAVVKAGEEYYVMAKDLVGSVMQDAKIEEYSVLGTVKGKDLEYVECAHPFLDRKSVVILGDHVTLESGTGCVHTAPGHGMDDFSVITQNYPELPVVVPVDDDGKMTEEAGFSAGLDTDEASKVIAKHLEESGHLLATKKFRHQYPHCWRCKQPILFRATEQWFCSVADFRDEAIEAVKQVHWIPGWGEERMTQMVEERSDWCISRQRNWGVPIPVFYCKKCGKYHIDDASIKAVSDLFRKEGSNAWYTHSAEEILPVGTTCQYCGGTEFEKETDIMDVWFDSGVSHASVLMDRLKKWPCDLYLEGADQFRGWFQSSLLTAVAWKGTAPYKNVCTVGWVVDGQGRKMSKSLGNGIMAMDAVEQYGADILRLWVASSDYHSDIRISPEILKQLSEVYRKIRNTARFILGNLYDFVPDTDSVAYDDLMEVDRWALAKMNDLVRTAWASYENFEFHDIYHGVYNFCIVDMSNFYLDVIKDRLYTEAAGSQSRRAAQTTIYSILRDLTLVLAPILAYTADEIWKSMPKSKAINCEHPVLNDIPAYNPQLSNAEFMAKWDCIHAVRDDVNKALELARNDKLIGKSLEAKVTLFCSDEVYSLLSPVEADLPMVFITSQVELARGGEGAFTGEVEGLSVTVAHAEGEKCERCWAYRSDIGIDPAHPTLCARCAKAISE